MMPTDLETRLRAAGDEIDRQIVRRGDMPVTHIDRRPVWTLALAVCAGALLMAGLVRLTSDDTPAGPASPATSDASTPPVTVPGTEPAVVSVAPSTTVVATTSTVPINDRPPIAIGESVMLGAQPELEAAGFTVYADKSAQGDAIANTIGQLRSAGQIGRTIVIQTGTNGPVSADTYAQIMSFLPADEVPNVLFLTVRAPGRGYIDDNNVNIWALPSLYPNVQLFDWKGLADSGGVPGLAGDGVHLGTYGAKQTYANYIFQYAGMPDKIVAVPQP